MRFLATLGFTFGLLLTFAALGAWSGGVSYPINLAADVGTSVLPLANGGTAQNSTATFPTSGVVMTVAGTVSPTNKTFTTASNGNTVNLLSQLPPQTGVTGNSAVQSLFTITIAQNVLGAGKCVHFEAGTQHSTGSASVTYNWSVIAGGGALANSGTSVASSSTAFTTIEIYVCNNAAVTNAQTIYQKAFMNGALIVQGGGTTTTSVDTTAAAGLQIDFTFNVANTDVVTPKYKVVTLLQ
jgi:hypothetical protein